MASSQISSSLPTFAEKDYVDMAHACRILGVSWQTVMRMAQSRMLRMVEWRTPSRRLVHYRSIVDFCDELRRQYLIPDRRPQLAAPYLRYCDEDVLPFPLSITMDSGEALAAMGRSNRHVIQQLVEEGRFEAYRLVVGAPWRISRPSFTRFMPAASGCTGRPGFSPESSLQNLVFRQNSRMPHHSEG